MSHSAHDEVIDQAEAGLQETPRDRRFIGALGRGIELLRCFHPGERWLGNQELAVRTGLSKATISRITFTLTRLGYLEHCPEVGKYAVGPAVLSLGYSAVVNHHVRRAAEPLMREMAQQTGASVALGVRDRLSILYIDYQNGHKALALKMGVGVRMPIVRTAAGRAYLCALDDSERDYLLELCRSRGVPGWALLRKAMDDALAEYRECGFVTSLDEWPRDSNCAAVPLVLRNRAGLMVLACGNLASQMRVPQLRGDVGPRLVRMAQEIGLRANQQEEWL